MDPGLDVREPQRERLERTIETRPRSCGSLGRSLDPAHELGIVRVLCLGDRLDPTRQLLESSPDTGDRFELFTRRRLGKPGLDLGYGRLKSFGCRTDLLAPRLTCRDALGSTQPLLQSRNRLVESLDVRRWQLLRDGWLHGRLRLGRARRTNLSECGPLLRERTRELQARDAALCNEDLAQFLPPIALRLEGLVELFVGDETLLDEDRSERAGRLGLAAILDAVLGELDLRSLAVRPAGRLDPPSSGALIAAGSLAFDSGVSA